MLRRLQKDVLKSLLPPRHEFLLFCKPSDEQCHLYKQITQRGCNNGVDDPLTLLTKVRKLCCHPHLLHDKEGMLSSLPPLTLPLPPQEEEKGMESTKQSGKLSILAGLLASIRQKSPNDKVVIVSNFTSALTLIERFVLKIRKWSWIRLDGTIEQRDRQPMVDSFNRGTVDHSFVFLLSSKAGGCGLNLIGANRLIMFDPDWNPATDIQAMARVYRQGQTKQCFIYRMFTTGTVEEVIYQRQTQKSNLATLAVGGNLPSGSGGKRQSARFTKEELRDCFTLKEGCACDTKQKVGMNWSDYGEFLSMLLSGKRNLLIFLRSFYEPISQRDFSQMDCPRCKTGAVLMSHSLQ
mmetsp:Transcript_26901/g.40189  ORF Transcript_26901/g.40189 Transcript_26901/m.40189 type:complete len:350 (-) Transcript_26901:559-1608(-)